MALPYAPPSLRTGAWQEPPEHRSQGTCEGRKLWTVINRLLSTRLSHVISATKVAEVGTASVTGGLLGEGPSLRPHWPQPGASRACCAGHPGPCGTQQGWRPTRDHCPGRGPWHRTLPPQRAPGHSCPLLQDLDSGEGCAPQSLSSCRDRAGRPLRPSLGPVVVLGALPRAQVPRGPVGRGKVQARPGLVVWWHRAWMAARPVPSLGHTRHPGSQV